MKFFINIFILIILSNQCFSLNIDETIKNTIENNPKVKISFENIKESQELINFSVGEKLPTITSSISGTYLNSDISSSVSTNPETLTDSYKITISQNLYDFGINDLEIERSKILFSNGMHNFNLEIQDLILDAINGYLSVVNYLKSLEANKKNYDSFFKVLEETKTRFSLGSATLYDLQQAEASFALASTNLFIAEQNVEISKKSFETIVGLKPLNLQEIITINDDITLEEIITNSLINNLNLQLILNDIKIQEILILKEKKSKKPSLDVVGTGLYSNSDRIDNGSKTTSGSIALTLTIPIFQKNQDNSNIRKFKSQLIQSKLRLEDEKNNLKILVSNTFKDFKISKSKMTSNLIIIKSIQTALDSLLAEYNIGTKTISDLIEQEEKLLNANVNFLDSKKDYLVNYFILKSLDGSLINLFEEYLPSIN